MIEVECKLHIDDINAVESKLLELGFTQAGLVDEVDRYFDNEAGQIRGNDSALRIRTTKNIMTGEAIAEINFKGPKLDKVSVTRPEFETCVTDEHIMTEILCQLGYKTVTPIVHKLRKSLVKDYITACLDDVEGLGTFLELEIVVNDDNKKDAALSEIESILNKLGYNMSDTTRVSYLSALQELLISP